MIMIPAFVSSSAAIVAELLQLMSELIMVVVTWRHQAYHMITVLTQQQTPLSTTLLKNGELHICEL